MGGGAAPGRLDVVATHYPDADCRRSHENAQPGTREGAQPRHVGARPGLRPQGPGSKVAGEVGLSADVRPAHRGDHEGSSTELRSELAEAADDRQLTKAIARYGRVDLLGIDELGYLELDCRGAELRFQVLTEREEKASAAIASNESFGGWIKTFTDPRLCAGIVDRLTFSGNVIDTACTDSYRLAHAKTQQGNG